ncbi:MAG: hypothetical protein KIS62_01270 [Ramlibacter sp.]|nr:hypothetical protein [Ramlibacter sp.]
MADHLQDQIMGAIKQTLMDAATNAGESVTIDGVDLQPIGKGDWIEIEAGGDESESTTIGFPPNQLRLFDIVIRCGVARKAAWRNAAGELAKQVEQALNASVSIFKAGGLASGGVHYASSTPDKDGTADKVVYTITQVWQARYRCAANAPDTPL